MSYGLQILDSSSAIVLDTTTRSARLVNTQTVTVSASVGTNTDYSIPADCTSANAFPVLDNGAGVAIVAAGTARVYGGQVNGTTTLKVYKYA